MGFVMKSVFWLGLVYAAMPFSDASTADIEAMACDAAVSPISERLQEVGPAYKKIAVAQCIANLTSRIAETTRSDAVTTKPSNVVSRASASGSLTASDLAPSWQGQDAAVGAHHRKRG